MAAAGPSANRSGRSRKSSTATPHPLPLAVASNVDAATPSAGGPGTSMPAPSTSTAGPMTVAECEHLAAQLQDTALPLRRRVEIASELRDSAESTRDYNLYERYLAIFIPVVTAILSDEKTVTFSKETPDQRFRHTLLAFLQRLPHTDPYKQHASAILELMIKLMKIENEENALTALKIMIDGFRNHKEQAESQVEAFLDLVKQMYTNIRFVVEKEFGAPSGMKPPVSAAAGPSPSTTPVTPSTAGESAPHPPPPQAGPSQHSLARALYSPKVLTECPIAVVLIFQTYKQTMAPALVDFYPLVMESIKLQPEPQRQAYLEAKERGEVFCGVAPGITNREMYTELIKAQVKTMAFLAYVLRGSAQVTNIKDYLEVFPEACLRLLRDCPPEDISTRKELLVATRHILTAESRVAFVPHVDTLLDERVMVGSGVSSRETLRPLSYSIIADLIHHVRNELPIAQLAKVAYIFSCNLNDSTYSISIHTMCAKLLNTILDSIHSKGDPQDLTKIMRSIFSACLERVKALNDAYDRLKAVSQRDKGKGKAKETDNEGGDVSMDEADTTADKQAHGWRAIEQAMPVQAVYYANDTLESFCKEARYLFKTLLHTFRTLLTHTRQSENSFPQPDGEILAALYRNSIRALSLHDGTRDPREVKEAIELLSQILLLYEPHVFSEVWTNHMDYFLEASLANVQIFPMISVLITHESVSHQLVGILLQYLMSNLASLGDASKQRSALTLRLFKMAFLAINTFIATNEAVLVPHLQELILDCFSHASKAKDPGIYYQILRALFRSIGGGRFEQLYKEVLPILEEMLDTLAYLLKHTNDPAQKDLFVELTLTVPVRLTNLLPHLGYLMKPLVHALQAGPDQVSQGLRTLELCIDNLTADFLDPTLGPVLRDLMGALHQLLKPIPANRNHAHTAAKILGKLGGRNRRFFEVELNLEYRDAAGELTAPVSFDGAGGRIKLSPLVKSAGAAIEGELVEYRDDGLQILMNSALTIFQEDAPSPEGNVVFQNTMSSLFLACGQPEIGERAAEFVHGFCRRTFALELSRTESHPGPEVKYSLDINKKRYLPLMSALSEIFVTTFADSKPAARDGLGELLAAVIGDFRTLATGPDFAGKIDGQRAVDRMIHTFCRSFIGLCHEEDWSKKMAGVAAIGVFVHKIDLNRRLLIDLENDIIRALFFCIRDAPIEAPTSVAHVSEMIKHLLRTCQSQEDGHIKLGRLIETLVLELHSQSLTSRTAAQESIQVLSETLGQTILEIIGPTVKSKVLEPQTGPIFSKPIRALPFPMQVAVIDAMTYLVEQRTVTEPSDEYVRLISEVLALADADKEQILPIKAPTHRQSQWLRTLRSSCLQLLRASMASPDLLTQNAAQMRNRIIQVYFKHVYSEADGINEVAHDGLKDVLIRQNKLPKEMLQAGLRPILVNLAEAKRLTVNGLDGLARFLELLTNYFKVEIGVKLLDHFESLGSADMLMKAAFSPLETNFDIRRMSRLINVFHLLPSTAAQYLDTLVTHVVDAEAHLHQSAPGPFTETLGKYVNKYHNEAAQHLLDNIRNTRYLWTFRNVISAGKAPELVSALSKRAEDIGKLCFSDPDAFDFVLPGLLLLRELTKASPSWLVEHESNLEQLVALWRSILIKSRDLNYDMSAVHYQQIPTLLLEMFMDYLQSNQHVQLLFHVVEVFEIRSPIERSSVQFFLYQQVALQESVDYRRDVIEQFFNLYDEDRVTWSFKTNAMRLVVNPTLRVFFDEGHKDGSAIVGPNLVHKLASSIWRPLANSAAIRQRDDGHLIEVFALTHQLVEHCPSTISEARKDVFKLAWSGLNLLEPTVKMMAYLLTARFMFIFETPAKFIRLTWTGLLRLKENENRSLYRSAVDIVASSLVLRDPPVGNAIPEWATRLKSVLVEEGPASNQIITVCEVLVNHPDTFYDYRELYVAQIANSLSKLAFVQAATPELKKLTVDVVELIFRWERRRIAAKEEAMDIDHDGGGKRAADSSAEPSPVKKQRLDRAGTAASSSNSGAGWATPSQVREVITAHVLRLVSTSMEPVARGGLPKRGLELFKEMLGPKGLPNVTIKLSYFHRTLTSDIAEQNSHAVANATEVLAAVASFRDQNWVKAQLGTLTKLLEKIWLFEDTGLHETITPLTESMFAEMPDNDEQEADPDAKALLQFVQNAVAEGLNAGSRSQAPLPGTLFLLKTWLKVKPKQHIQPEPIGTGLLKVLANLTKVHTGANGSDSASDPASRLIMSVLDVIRDRVGDLRDQRKHLISVLSALIDRSTNTTLCQYLLDLVRQWVIEDPDPSLGKERASLLLKMSVFEQRDEALFEKYLDLIYDIYKLDTLRGTDITHRLEPAFLLGAKSKSVTQRGRFLDKLEQSLPRTLDGRLQYLYSLQNWDTLADSYWIPQILSTVLGIVDSRQALIRRGIPKILDNDPMVTMAASAVVGDIIGPARNLIHSDGDLAHALWVSVFPLAWAALTRPQQTSFTGYIVKLLSKEYHSKQVEMRPNVIQTFLDGILPCSPIITLPPLLIKYLAKTFNAWYVGFEILTKLSDIYRPDDILRESCASALSELYAELCEDDMFYGLARSRCVFPETTAALSYEQNGQWPKAMEMYEQAQMRARNGLLPFTEEEYCFWEDHWILAAQKLQNWDTLTELAKIEQDPDLLLECAWRLVEWSSPDREIVETSLARVVDAPTPRRKTFEAFNALLKAHLAREPPNDFVRILDETQQVTLRKWVSLPNHVTAAHLPLLQMFQQCVELGEAASVFDVLSQTNAQNLEGRITADLKSIFQTWRDRLPNFWDDIMVWSDLLAWRQHVFQSVTRVCVPLIPPGETATYGFRGYHETAWMINRFGEVARRHGLLDVCSVALNKIYALPNIEISEAFLKLREQALCFFQKPDKFNDGLENISTTNLMYFAPSQKAEFLTLKGMFISRLGENEQANAEFAHAIQMDMNLPKAWAEWGRFNDKLYRDRPEHSPGPPEPKPGEARISDADWAASYARDRALLASSAVSCYLQAAGLYSNHKSRGLLLRVLWLLGLDDKDNTIAKAFENYKGDPVVWYWITLIPQLILSLSHREAKQARYILSKIAKAYPQALFYQLRVAREDFSNVKRQQTALRAAAAKRQAEVAKTAATANGTQNGDPAVAAVDSPKPDNKDGVKEEQAGAMSGAAPVASATNGNTNGTVGTPNTGSMPPPSSTGPPAPRQPWELTDELMNTLKTSFPLLALTMEKMVDQISVRAKPASDEDIYRFFAALLADALQQWGGRSGVPNDDGELSQMTKENLSKFSNNLTGDLRSGIERDFMTDMPKLREYITRLQWWRDSYEKALDARPRSQPLDQGGCNLIEFHHTKFEGVDIPGQYAHHIEHNEETVKIARFSPKAELGRGHGHCFRRITMIGENGSTCTFNVQMPAARHCRREERLTQLFRIMNSVLKKRKESRRRNLQFHLPTAVALAPQLRLVQNDSSYISLQDVFDDFCDMRGMSREDSIMKFYDRVKQLHDPSIPRTDNRFVQLKMEVMEEISAKTVPETVLTNYMIKTMCSPESLWLMRKQFAMQTATVMFLSYVCCLSNRTPSRFHLSRKTGLMYMTEILPAFAPGQAYISSSESVPFRLTPNMQHFITRTGIEGVVTACTTAIARSLTMPEFDLAGTLSLFIRDEILTWHNTYMKEPRADQPLTATVYKNVDTFIRRASMMGYLGEPKEKASLNTESPERHTDLMQGPNVPPMLHVIVTLISQATSPHHLAQMGESFMAWF
ncbi:putative histone acetyltransferase [Naematelia encephala]|uniref:Putative histone acetyltransferase n=1 Tax=Naematelia encephala TaxID=71784 RepID=A0A1Y2AVJ7_9TREE|nr:putative histone acetyltransferase [Naematelia encephala]